MARISGGVARVVIVADRQREVIERGQRVAVFGLESGQTGRQVCLVEAVAAVLSDHQAPAQGVTAHGRDRRRGRRSRRPAARTRAHTGCRWPRRRRSDRSRRPSPHHRNRRTPVREPGHALVSVWVSRPRASWARHHSTDRSGWPMSHVRSAEQALDAVRHLVAATADQPSGRRRCSGQPPRSVRPCSTATPSRTGTRAGDGRRRGRVRSALRPRRSARNFRPRTPRNAA